MTKFQSNIFIRFEMTAIKLMFNPSWIVRMALVQDPADRIVSAAGPAWLPSVCGPFNLITLVLPLLTLRILIFQRI